jgi:hypothetical protein
MAYDRFAIVGIGEPLTTPGESAINLAVKLVL